SYLTHLPAAPPPPLRSLPDALPIFTRREVLVRVLPRMAKLAGRWELGERFLTVRGDLRTYKIHLGSGNILMEPNDQYLCIVPGRDRKSTRLNSSHVKISYAVFCLKK